MKAETLVSGRDRFWRRLLDRRRFMRRLMLPRVALRVHRRRAHEAPSPSPMRAQPPVYQQTSVHLSPSMSLHLHLGWPRWLNTGQSTTLSSRDLAHTVTSRTTALHHGLGLSAPPPMSRPFTDSRVNAGHRSTSDVPTTRSGVARQTDRQESLAAAQPTRSSRSHIVSSIDGRNTFRLASRESTAPATAARVVARTVFAKGTVKSIAAAETSLSPRSEPGLSPLARRPGADLNRGSNTTVARQHKRTHEPSARISPRQPLASRRPRERATSLRLPRETVRPIARHRQELEVRPITRTLAQSAASTAGAIVPTPAAAASTEAARSVPIRLPPHVPQPIDVGRLSDEVYRQIERRIRIERERRGI